MKVFVIIALFVCVAVQLSHSAPMPEDDKKDEATTGAPAARVAEDKAPPAVEAKADEPKKTESVSTTSDKEEKKDNKEEKKDSAP